jgi:parallel beta-helix repeat protein
MKCSHLICILGILVSIQIICIGSAYANHCILYDLSSNSVSVICGSARLSDINDQLVNSSIINRESKTNWTLNANLIIGNDASFNIDSIDTKWLKVNSTTQQDAHYIEVFGNLTIDSVKISSWNTTSGNYTTTNGKSPRAAIVIPPTATGKTQISNSEIEFLGYNSTLREGLSFYGGRGGILENNTIHNMWHGLYSKGVNNLKIKDNRFFENSGGNVYQLPGHPQSRISSNIRGLVAPLIAINSPTFNSTLTSGDIMVEGTSFDEDRGIKNVQVLVDKYPRTGNTFNYVLANPVTSGNWAKWSVPLEVKETGPHRILAMATDLDGLENWAEVVINVSSLATHGEPLLSEHSKNRIAFVQPSFTEGAYNVGGFYTFYPKYNSTPFGKKIITDLRNLTAVVPEELGDEKYYGPLVRDVLKLIPNTTVSIIRDEDVYNGYIFRADGSNAYDVLFLLHNEYAARQDYDNFKKFVSNGGTIVFLDGNAFYAQVYYNKDMHTVTLFSGHDWLFDGKAATKSVHEGYYDENKKWVGSNFLYGDISAPVTFISNPFNYTHFEENYVNNPNATILYDYGAQIPESVRNDNDQVVYPKIATYELNYGKGKVIMMGLYTQNLGGNNAFMKFFDHIILPRALGQPYKFNNAAADGNASVAFWWMNTGRVSNMSVESPSNKVNISLERSKQIEDTLMLTLPDSLVGGRDSGVRNITITVDGKPVRYNQSVDDIETGFEIPLSPKATGVQVSTSTTVEIAEGSAKPTNSEFYVPDTILIPRGTTVIWINNDDEIHTVTSGNPDVPGSESTLFDSSIISSGRTFGHTFADRGSFDYYCTLHPFMKGRVIVR